VWVRNWVIDLDIQGFFDNLDHELVVKAVAHHLQPDQRWILLYVRRWLSAPLQSEDGTLVARDRGSPQGSATSPHLGKLKRASAKYWTTEATMCGRRQYVMPTASVWRMLASSPVAEIPLLIPTMSVLRQSRTMRIGVLRSWRSALLIGLDPLRHADAS
jgi:hypothetical protein